MKRSYLLLGSLGMLFVASVASYAGENKRMTPINMHFMAVSEDVPTGDIVIMGGDGHLTPGNIVANGSFQHWTFPPDSPPEIVGQGSWKAKKLLDWDKLGDCGIGIAGVATMEVDLVPENGGRPISAVLEVTCNIGLCSLFTGKAEGYVLEVGGFIFEPRVPMQGVTWYTSVVESRN